MLAERYFPDDPNTSLLKLRQLAELLAQLVATKVGLYLSREEAQYDLLRRLQDQGILRAAALRRGPARGAASHATGRPPHRPAALKITGNWALVPPHLQNPAFKSGPFIPPQAPRRKRRAACRAHGLSQALEEGLAAHQEPPASRRRRSQAPRPEQTFWEQMASEAEQQRPPRAEARRTAGIDRRAAQRDRGGVRRRGEHCGCGGQLDETDTRKLIDEQLRQAGWTADSATLIYAQGARPEKKAWRSPSGLRTAARRLRAVRRSDAGGRRRGQAQEHRRLGGAATSQALQPGFMPSLKPCCTPRTGGRMARTAFRSSSRPTAAPSCGSSPPRAASGSATCAAPRTSATRSTAGTRPKA